MVDAKETLQEIKKMENQEIAELDIKYKFTSEKLAKKENIEKEYLKVKCDQFINGRDKNVTF